MKITSLGIKNDDVYGSYKEAVISTLISYGKMYKLIHKQLWDKSRISFVDYEFSYNGRNVKPIKYWNIKSSSSLPYNPDPAAVDELGLNQLFMGQDPYSEYVGDLKDGIYHDDCLIQPKRADLPSEDRMGWFLEGNGNWQEKDIWGNTLVTNVYTYEKTHIVHHDAVEDDPDTEEDESADAYDEEVSDGMYCVVETPDGSSEFAVVDVTDDSGEESVTYTPTVEYVNFSSENFTGIMLPKSLTIPDLTVSHGDIVYSADDVPTIRPIGSFTAVWFMQSSAQAKTFVYKDGTCVQIATPTVYASYAGDDSVTTVFQDGTISYLPLCYMDSGDLVQNRVDFIENWDDMFELYVHEDGYWYDAVIKIVVIVVSAVIAYISAGVLSGWSASTATMTLAAFGGAMSGIGTVSGDKVFSVIGAIITLGTGLVASSDGAIYTAAMAKGFSERTARQAVVEAGFGDLIQGFTSTIGFGNLTKIGSSLFSIYNTISTPTLSEQSTQEVEETKMTVYVYSDTSGSNYIDKVMNIAKL